jgi:molecular chaperone GrpE
MNPEDDLFPQDAESSEDDEGRPTADGMQQAAEDALSEPEAQPTAEAEGPAIVLSAEECRQLQAAAAERDDYLKRLQRATADYQNLQKRTAKLSEMAIRNAIRQFALQVVPLADTLARALSAVEQSEDAGNFPEGLRLIEKEFYTILGNLGIEPMEAVGKPFDPAYHEAAFQEPAEGLEPNTVVREIKKGFTMGGEVIRPAQVTVAAPPADGTW